MSNHNACPEYRTISRRQFVSGASLLAAAAALPGIAPRISFAQGTSVKDTVILIQLRGGADPLTFCPPHGDPIYYQVRPTLAIPQPNSGFSDAAIDLDGYFGFARSFEPLMNAFNDGNLGVINAVGRANWTRSHFDAQNWMQTDMTNLNEGGWLSRHLASSEQIDLSAPFRGVAFSDATPLVLSRGGQVSSMGSATNFSFDASFPDDLEVANTIRRLYSRVRDESRDIVRDSSRAIDTLHGLDVATYASASNLTYPNSYIGNSLKATAAMIKGEIGVEVLCVDTYGWDTHGNQGSRSGALANMMTDLANSLAAFYADMESTGKTNWTIVVMSEFGRQVEENGSRGTDHGTAGTMLTMGPNVVGGIHADWPGLEVENRYEGVDLAPTKDYRDVLGDLVQCRLQNANTDYIFPSKAISHQPLGYFEAA
jgi:uncharacterized protein (DUF1501 family)